MNGDLAVTATFTQNEYTLTVSTVGSGSVVKSPSQVTYHYGDVVVLTESPVVGYSFSGWSGDGTGLGTTRSVTVIGNMAVGASFVQGSYSVTVTVTTGAHGTVSPGNQTLNWGTSVSLTITPDIGYHVADVLVNGSSVGAVASYTFTAVSAGNTISASFAPDTYVVTFTESGLPSGTPWKITFNEVTQSSTTTTISFTDVASGNYSWSTSTQIFGGAGIQYVASLSSATIGVSTETSQTITYTTQYCLTSQVLLAAVILLAVAAFLIIIIVRRRRRKREEENTLRNM
jgi:hypothetical protein